MLRHETTPIGVVEAKRDGGTFALDGIQYSSKPVGLGLLAKESEPARKAMIQAAGYAASLGTKYVVITNGHQYIITLAFVSGKQIEQRSVMVFEGLDAIDERFRAFFDCLSPVGLRANKLAAKLLESRRAPAPTKLSSSIHGSPEPADRNIIVNEISWVLSTVWDKTNENDEDDDFLKRCYVTPEASTSTLAQAKEIIEQRSHLDQSLVPAEVHPQSDAIGVVSAPRPEKPIIVLGRVGHGKSTFLDYLRLVEAKDQLSGYIQVEIDFLDRPTGVSEVEDHVFQTFDRQVSLKTKCVEDKLGENLFVSLQDEVRITSLGKFIVSDLIKTFVYLDAVVVDTPIADDNVRAEIRDERTIKARVSRGRTFKQYLDTCAKAIRDNDASSFWRTVSDSLDADMDRVTSSAHGRR